MDSDGQKSCEMPCSPSCTPELPKPEGWQMCWDLPSSDCSRWSCRSTKASWMRCDGCGLGMRKLRVPDSPFHSRHTHPSNISYLRPPLLSHERGNVLRT